MDAPDAPLRSVEEDATLRRIVDTIVGHLDPEQIILFGSRARGDDTAHGDYDIGVVMELGGHRRELVRQIHGLFGLHGFSMDAFVLSPAELEKQETVANTLGYIVARDGEVLYEGPSSRFQITGRHVPQHRCPNEKNLLNLQPANVQRWKVVGESFS